MTLAEPPWADTEWNESSGYAATHGGRGHFRNWPMLAPKILEFTKK